MTAQQIIQLAIALLFVLGPVLGKVAQKASEAKKERERKQRREQAELEALRTGRATEPVPAQATMTASQRLQEQIREREMRASPIQSPMRARQTPQAGSMGRRGGKGEGQLGTREGGVSGVGLGGATLGGGIGGIQMRRIRLPGGIEIEVPVQVPEGQSAGESVRRPAPPPQQAKREKAKKQRQQAQPVQLPVQQSVQQPVQSAIASAYEQPAAPAPSISKAFPPAGMKRGPVGLAAILGRQPSRADVRRAVILSEVFGAPVSSRSV